jgi:hypothetical protein
MVDVLKTNLGLEFSKVLVENLFIYNIDQGLITLSVDARALFIFQTGFKPTFGKKVLKHFFSLNNNTSSSPKLCALH